MQFFPSSHNKSKTAADQTNHTLHGDTMNNLNVQSLQNNTWPLSESFGLCKDKSCNVQRLTGEKKNKKQKHVCLDAI